MHVQHGEEMIAAAGVLADFVAKVGCRGPAVGRFNGAAALLDIKPTTLESRIKKLGLVQKP
jgi:hypothetical protein